MESRIGGPGRGEKAGTPRAALPAASPRLQYPDSNSLQMSVYLKNEGLASYDAFRIVPKP